MSLRLSLFLFLSALFPKPIAASIQVGDTLWVKSEKQDHGRQIEFLVVHKFNEESKPSFYRALNLGAFTEGLRGYENSRTKKVVYKNGDNQACERFILEVFYRKGGKLKIKLAYAFLPIYIDSNELRIDKKGEYLGPYNHEREYNLYMLNTAKYTSRILDNAGYINYRLNKEIESLRLNEEARNKADLILEEEQRLNLEKKSREKDSLNLANKIEAYKRQQVHKEAIQELALKISNGNTEDAGKIIESKYSLGMSLQQCSMALVIVGGWKVSGEARSAGGVYVVTFKKEIDFGCIGNGCFPHVEYQILTFADEILIAYSK